MKRHTRLALAALGVMAGCAMAHGQTTIYRSSFEGTDGGWVGTGDWERGVPSTPSAGCSTDNLAVGSAFDGSEVWATGLDFCHADCGCFMNLSQTFDLSLSTNTKLSWQQALSVFGNFDFVNVFVNGVSVYFFDSSTPIPPWQFVQVDLSPWDGNPSVEVVFSLFATTVVNRPGWYIDDVHIEGDVPAPGVNYRLQLTPSAPNATPSVAACDITFSATVSNIGLDNATGGATFSAPLPFNGTFVSGSGASLDMGNIVASIPALNSGQAHTFSFVLNANADGLMSVVGNVTLASDTDTDLSNNTATANVEVSSALPNDNCCAAHNLNMETFPFNTLVDNSAAFNGPNAGACTTLTFGRNDFWYVFTAPADGILTMNESGTQDIAWGIFPPCGAESTMCLATDTNQNVQLNMGQTVYVQVSAQTATTNVTVLANLTFDFLTAPANDVCSGAEEIFLPYANIVSNLAATNSGNVAGCENFGDLWYKWVATATGSMRLNESGGQNAGWAVYEGVDCNSLSLVACTTTDTNVYPSVFNGNTYWIRIGADTLATARTTNLNFTIDLFSPPPANDTCATAEEVLFLPYSNSADNQSATNSGMIAGCENFGDVWYKWVATATGSLRLTETGSQNAAWAMYEGVDCNSLSLAHCSTTDLNQYATVFNGNTYYIRLGSDTIATLRSTNLAFSFDLFSPPPANDTCASAQSLMSLPFSDTVANESATNSGNIGGCDNFGDIWYTWVAPADGNLLLTETGTQNASWAVYLGSDCNSLAPVICSLTDTNQTAPVTMGNTYKIRVGTDTAALTRVTPLTFTIDFAESVTNVHCVSAINITSSTPYTAIVPNADVADSGFISGCELFGDVWYTFTAPSNGVLNVTETGTQNAGWAIYEGTDCNALSNVLCTLTDTNQNVLVSMGNTYKIRVGADTAAVVRTSPLNITINFFPAPANDECDDAVVLDVMVGGLEVVDARGAQNDADIACNGTTPEAIAGVWYTFTTGAQAGVLNVEETSTASVATEFYTGSCGFLTPIINACSTTQNRFVAVDANTTYYFIMSMSAGTRPTVPYAFGYSFIPPPPNDLCSGAEVLDLSSPGNIVVNAVGATDDDDIDCNGASPVAVAGVWYTFTTGLEGGVLNINETSTATVATQLYTGDCNSLSTVPGSCSTTQNRNFVLDPGTTYFMIMSMSATTRPTVAYAFSYNFIQETGACCVGSMCTITTLSDCNAASGTFQGVGMPCSGAPNYVSSDPAGTIPDLSFIDHTITTSDTDMITTLEVVVDAQHTWAGDLILSLIGPNLAEAKLLTRPGRAGPCEVTGSPFGTGNDLDGVYIFSDDGVEGANAASVANLVMPSGTYRATDCENVFVDLNTVFGGMPVTGTWTLRAQDWASSLTGLLRGFSLVVNGGLAPPCDSVPCPGDYNDDGVVDLGDLLDFLGDWNPNLGQSGMGLPGDINDDGVVDLGDLLDFLGDWNPNLGSTCP